MDDVINVRLEIPAKSIDITLKLNNDDLVWNIKGNILNTIAPDLKDSLNYGFYQPSNAFKAAKYLDEDRCLREYNLEDGAELQLISKKRIYKASTLNTKKLKEINIKSNRKKFIQYIFNNTVDKATRLLVKGLDPNFIDPESGECPITLSTQLSAPHPMMTSLVEGGAHLDYRNREGWTAMHKAAHLNNLPALQALLNFGASANYRDRHGLTPLYISVCKNSNPTCVGALLREFALLGIVDGQGNTELHQACKNGRVQHLDLLITYGAGLNSINNNGNTPLHICAMHNQEECARMLLFRGADKFARNLINQDPAELAGFYKHTKLQSIIESHRLEDSVVSHELPTYNDKSRSTLRKRNPGNLLTSKLSKMSQSTPYLHESVSNNNNIKNNEWGTLSRSTTTTHNNNSSFVDLRNSVRSFDSAGNSTGSADQQFEFDVTPTSSNESRPASWVKQQDNNNNNNNNNNGNRNANNNNRNSSYNNNNNNNNNIGNNIVASRNYNSTINIPESLRDNHKPLKIFGNKNFKLKNNNNNNNSNNGLNENGFNYQRSQSSMPGYNNNNNNNVININDVIRNKNNNNNSGNRVSMMRRQSCDDILNAKMLTGDEVYCNGFEVNGFEVNNSKNNNINNNNNKGSSNGNNNRDSNYNNNNNNNKHEYVRRTSLENAKPKVLTPFKMAEQHQHQQQQHQQQQHQQHQQKQATTPTQSFPQRNSTFPILPTFQQPPQNIQQQQQQQSHHHQQQQSYFDEPTFPPPPPEIYLNANEVGKCLNQPNKTTTSTTTTGSMFALTPRRFDNNNFDPQNKNAPPSLPPKLGTQPNLPDFGPKFSNTQQQRPQQASSNYPLARNVGQFKQQQNINVGFQSTNRPAPDQNQNQNNLLAGVSLKSPTNSVLSPKSPNFGSIPPPPTFPPTFKTLASPTNSNAGRINSCNNNINNINNINNNNNNNKISNMNNSMNNIFKQQQKDWETPRVTRPSWGANNNNNNNTTTTTIHHNNNGPLSPPLPPPPSDFITANDFNFPPPPLLFNSNNNNNNSNNNNGYNNSGYNHSNSNSNISYNNDYNEQQQTPSQNSELLAALVRRKNMIEQ